MVKKLKKLFQTLINKPKTDSNLEIDAAVVSSNNDIEDRQQNIQQQQQQRSNDERNDSQQLENNGIDRFDTPQNSIVPSNSVIDLHSVSPFVPINTVGEVNNVQNVYNFSNIDGLHIGNSMIIHSNTNSNSTNINKNRNRNINNSETSNTINSENTNNQNKIKITPPIEVLFRSREDVEETVLSELSEFVGINYQRLMRNLGLTQAQIETVELDYNCLGHKEIIFQLLLKWSEEFYENANYGKLSRNLWRCDCREAVVKLEQILFRIQNKNESKEKETENLKFV